MLEKRSFVSDNNAGIHPEVLQAMIDANVGHEVGYGEDPYTERAIRAFRDHFGEETEVFLVFNGTAANVVSAGGVCTPYQALICGDCSHIHVSESGAVERFVGCRVYPAPTVDGKLTAEAVEPLTREGIPGHNSQPRLLSITQATEMGTVYTVEETRVLADFVHERGMLLHLDGARLANAAAALGLSLRAVTLDAGVDIVSFGGTKNGMMLGEAVLFFDPGLARDFGYVRKQGLQLASKMRFISAQFEAVLRGDLRHRTAEHANRMAQLLAAKVRNVPNLKILYPAESNGVFAEIPTPCVAELQKEFYFIGFDFSGPTCQVRWMASFDTTEEDVERFAAAVDRIVGGYAG